MKKFTVLLIVLALFFALPLFAQTTTEPKEKVGFGLDLAMGQDNAYLCQGGKCFLAVGGGMDFFGYSTPVGTKGSIFDVKLHGMILAKVSDNQTGTIYGLATTLDLVKLMTGTKLTFLLPNLSCLIGPAVGYDVDKGSVAYGGMLNFSYKF